MRTSIFLLVFCLVAADGSAARGRAPRHTHAPSATPRPPPPPPARADGKGDALPPGAIARLGSVRLRHAPAARGVAFQSARALVSAGQGLASFALPAGKPIRASEASGQCRVRSAGHDHSPTVLAGADDPHAARPGKGAGRADRSLWRLAISGDGKRAAAGQVSGTVTIVDLGSGAETGSQRSPGGRLVGLAYPKAGQAVLAAWADGAVRWISAKGAFTRDRFWIEAPVRAVAVAPDGKTLAASHGAGLLEIRDAKRGSLVRAFEAPPPDVRALAFSPDGAKLACQTAEGVAVLDVKSGEVERAIELDEEGRGPHGIAFAPDGAWFAVAAHPGRVHVYDAKTGAEKLVLDHGKPGVTRRRPTFAIQPGGGGIATAGQGVTLRLWDTKTGAEVSPLAGHRDRIEQVAFAPGAAVVATGGADGTVRLWGPGGEERQVVTVRPAGMGFLADGQLLAWVPSKEAFVITDVASGARVAEIKDGPHEAEAPPDPEDPDPFPMKPPSEEAPAAPVSALPADYLGSDAPLVSGVAGHLETLWPDALALPAAAARAGATLGAALTGDAAALATLDPPPSPPPAPPPPLVSALSTETGMLAVVTGQRIQLHDARTGVAAKQLELGEAITALAFSPDGAALVAGAADGSTALLDVASGQATPMNPPGDSPVRGVSFGADGQTVAWITAAGQVGVRRRSGGEATLFDGAQNGRAHHLALSPDGRWLATAGGDGTHVFELVTRAEVAHLLGHGGDVLKVAFSSDSRVLASASADGTAVLWDAQRFEQLIK